MTITMLTFFLAGFSIMCAVGMYSQYRWMRLMMEWQKTQDKAIAGILERMK